MDEHAIEGGTKQRQQILMEEFLLERKRERMQRKASELHAECKRIQNESASPDRCTNPFGINISHNPLRDFTDPNANIKYSSMLKDAVVFCETRDGCPFFGDQCSNDRNKRCRGIWIQVGSVCNVFAEYLRHHLKISRIDGK